MHAGSHNNWTEVNFTNGNRPSAGPQLDSVSGLHSEGKWKEFGVKKVITDDGIVTFVVQIDGRNDVWFRSSEGDEPPQLVVDLAPTVYPPGDYNRDSSVNQQDQVFWNTNYGATAGMELQVDGSGNGVVDAADFTIWRDHLEDEMNEKRTLPSLWRFG